MYMVYNITIQFIDIPVHGRRCVEIYTSLSIHIVFHGSNTFGKTFSPMRRGLKNAVTTHTPEPLCGRHTYV